MASEEKKLKSGFTTGAAAAAAAKGALYGIIERQSSEERKPPLAVEIRAGEIRAGEIRASEIKAVEIRMLSGQKMAIPITSFKSLDDDTGECMVTKDAGDDPDVTHRALIGAKVFFKPDTDKISIRITGGSGVGKVTKPGLEVPVGEAAINQGPQKMIREAVNDILDSFNLSGDVHVKIFVPRGQQLAEKTLNARLGIIGGISILGTTGIVRPMSHDAYLASIEAALSVASAAGCRHVVFATGRRSERHAADVLKTLPEEAFIQTGDFFKASLESAASAKISAVTLAVFFGKAVKMAQGFAHTHAGKSELNIEQLASWCFSLTGNRTLTEKIEKANTARHAFEMIVPEYPELIAFVGKKMLQTAKKFAGPDVKTGAMIFDYDGKIVFDTRGFDTNNQENLL
ncbi:cobalt-precorrin-5B (C(1))-methyltransferase CbiD [Desulfobacterales bacterium HSG16]|nr:cobalt-precorrin-5B (C(1))-methyltransferase CbiD [Desulfobacterales bacterium HSG16]